MESRRPDGNLPAPTTTFIGRSREITDVSRQLASARLVTLTGVGGVGKTRLAIQIASQGRRAFPDGAWLVDLAALEDPALVADSVANTLGIPDQSARWPVAVLSDHLSSRNLLLVLDNCEHLLDACAVLADALLKAAADLRILATSRQPLGVPGEQTVVVPPLAVPDTHSAAPVTTLASYDAVRLFVTRAGAVLPGFRLTESNAAVVAALCTRLDGLPLAIELAAVRLRALSPEQILSRLDERFRLLTQGNRIAAPRHQTLRALVAWSYELCSTEEQTLWNRVSVFVGSFDLDAVENVCADDSLPRQQLLDLVAGLVDKSVLLREEHDASVRYRLLDTIRAYGRQRLADGADNQVLRRRHRDYYLQLATSANTEWFSAEGPRWRERLRLELPNLRAALDFCLSDPAEAEPGMDLAATLAFGWRVLGLLGEGRRWLDRLLLASTEPTPPRAHALAVNGSLAILQGDIAAASALLDESTSVAESFTDSRSTMVQAYAALFSGLVAMADGDMVTAADLLDQAFISHNATANPLWAAFALLWLSMAASTLADPVRAEQCAADYVALCAAHGADWLTGFGHFALALEYWRRGDASRAAEEARRTIQAVRDQDSISIAAGTEVLAWVAAAKARPRRAARLLGAVDEIWRTVGAPLVGVPHLTPHHDECVRRTRTALGQQDFVTATEQGARLDMQALIAYALEETESAPTLQSRSPLTRREHEVAELVAAGLSNKKIASTLTISARTAETHVEHILTKLGFTSRAQIATWVTARNNDQLQVPDGEPS